MSDVPETSDNPWEPIRNTLRDLPGVQEHTADGFLYYILKEPQRTNKKVDLHESGRICIATFTDDAALAEAVADLTPPAELYSMSWLESVGFVRVDGMLAMKTRDMFTHVCVVDTKHWYLMDGDKDGRQMRLPTPKDQKQVLKLVEVFA